MLSFDNHYSASFLASFIDGTLERETPKKNLRSVVLRHEFNFFLLSFRDYKQATDIVSKSFIQQASNCSELIFIQFPRFIHSFLFSCRQSDKVIKQWHRKYTNIFKMVMR